MRLPGSAKIIPVPTVFQSLDQRQKTSEEPGEGTSIVSRELLSERKRKAKREWRRSSGWGRCLAFLNVSLNLRGSWIIPHWNVENVFVNRTLNNLFLHSWKMETFRSFQATGLIILCFCLKLSSALNLKPCDNLHSTRNNPSRNYPVTHVDFGFNWVPTHHVN